LIKRRKFLYISRSPKLLLKFFKNKEFLHKLQLAKRNNLLQQENCDDRTVSPHFLSLINKSINSNENSKYNSSRIKELDDSKKLTLTNKTPSFKYESSCRSINNTVSNINPPETGINTNSENSKHNDYKDANVVFCKINRESIKDQTFKTTKDIIKQSSNQILYYGNIMEKNSYGTEFTKLSSSIHSANQSLYDSKASYNTGCLFNVKSNTINDNRPQNVLSK
jgi:hypothetical protein